jgi:hypothetical protein
MLGKLHMGINEILDLPLELGWQLYHAELQRSGVRTVGRENVQHKRISEALKDLMLNTRDTQDTEEPSKE